MSEEEVKTDATSQEPPVPESPTETAVVDVPAEVAPEVPAEPAQEVQA